MAESPVENPVDSPAVPHEVNPAEDSAAPLDTSSDVFLDPSQSLRARKTALTIFLGISITVSIGFIVLGNVYQDNCPVQHRIPEYVVLVGEMGIVVSILFFCYNLRTRYLTEKLEDDCCCTNPIRIFAVFVVIVGIFDTVGLNPSFVIGQPRYCDFWIYSMAWVASCAILVTLIMSCSVIPCIVGYAEGRAEAQAEAAAAAESSAPPNPTPEENEDQFENALKAEILQNTGVYLNDVIGADTAKEALCEAISFAAANPAILNGLHQPAKGILLFGPPGNGKTMLAKAIASVKGHTFFNISASSLVSKFVGDSEKTVKTLFKIAREAQPSIIFIDEIDSILRESGNDSSIGVKTEFLRQFGGAAAKKEDKILVIGATNHPHKIDDDILQRFPKRIMLGLPDKEGRELFIHTTLMKNEADSCMSQTDIRGVATQTDGYSKSDLMGLCTEAAMVAVREMSSEDLAKAETKVRDIKPSDFESALKVIKPSTKKKLLDDINAFALKHGQSHVDPDPSIR